MGRSVSTPSNASIVIHAHYDPDEEYDFNELLDDLRDGVIAADKNNAFDPADKWLDREDHVILQSDHFDVGVSEYCGMIAFWAVEREIDDDDVRDALRHAAVAAALPGIMRKALRDAGAEVYERIGTFSNGESVYKRETCATTSSSS